MRSSAIVILLHISLLSAAQKVDKWIYIGKELEEKGELNEACKIYEHGVSISIKNPELNYRYAECLHKLLNYEMAERFYQHTIETDTAGRFPDALVKLATLQKNNGRYYPSLKTWEMVKRLNEQDTSSVLYQKASKEVDAGWAIIQGKIPSYNIPIVNLGALNSHEAEFAGAYYDTTSLIYSSFPHDELQKKERSPDDIRLFAAYKALGHWHSGQALPEIINTPAAQNANGSFSSDRKYLVFSRCSGGEPCQLFVSRYEKGKYGQPQPLNVNVAGSASTQPCLVRDASGSALFFSSNRPGGKGGYDLWMARGDTLLNFSAPVNLESLNSPEDELSPFYHAPSGIFYFSSTWHPGFGGYDIFRSFSPDLQSFSQPENVGRPFNSPANDVYFTLGPAGRKGLLTSNRVGSKSTFGKTCCNDLYEFDFPSYLHQPRKQKDIQVVVSTDTSSVETLYAKLKQLLPIQLYFHNDEPDPKTTNPYTFRSYGEAYTSYLSVRPDYERENKLYVNALYDSYVTYGYLKLRKFLELMSLIPEKGSALEIGIKGYASPLAQTQYNINLTSRRIESFVNEMKEFESGRLLPYLTAGKDQPNVRITKLPYGENKSAAGVSDDIRRKDLSVYSIEAALERRIEIVAADLRPLELMTEAPLQAQLPAANVEPSQSESQTEADSAETSEVNEISPAEENAHSTPSNPEVNPEAAFQPTLNFSEVRTEDPKPEAIYLSGNIQLDLGTVQQGKIIDQEIKFRNTYGRNISFARVVVDCGCTGLIVPDKMLVPDEETTFTLRYDTKGKAGRHENEIQVITRELSEPIRIKFALEVR